MQKIKILEILSKIFFALFCLMVIYDFFARAEQKFYCFGYQVDLYILFSFLIIAIVFEIIALLIQRKHQISIKNPIKNFIKFLLVSFIFTFILLIILWPQGGREKAKDAERKADIRTIQLAQEMCYDDPNCKVANNYADSQKELVEFGYLPEILVDPETKKEYTDEDGFGLDGGDKNSKTWMVKSVLEKYNEICSREKPIKIFYCNEKGCGEKIINNGIEF